MKRKVFLEAMYLCALFVAVSLLPFGTEISHGARNINHVLSANGNLSSSDGNISVSYTNSSFTIDSDSHYGAFSFTSQWSNDGFVMYNGMLRSLRVLDSITFTDKKAGYEMEYYIPVMLLDYIDLNGNNIPDDPNNTAQLNTGPDIIIVGYKIHDTIEITNVTVTENPDGVPVCEWSFVEVASPMASGVTGLERFPIVTQNFHYYALNGTLKMDIVIQNFRDSENEFAGSYNASSRVFISYGVRYVSLEPGNVTVAFDDKELAYDMIDHAYPVTSKLVAFKVDGKERGFFDFGGKITIDDNPNMYVNGSVGPARSYYYYEEGKGIWLEIGLSYPPVNQTLIHDPYFGLYSGGAAAITLPFTWTVALAVISVIICTLAIADFLKMKSRHPKLSIKPSILALLAKIQQSHRIKHPCVNNLFFYHYATRAREMWCRSKFQKSTYLLFQSFLNSLT